MSFAHVDANLTPPDDTLSVSELEELLSAMPLGDVGLQPVERPNDQMWSAAILDRNSMIMALVMTSEDARGLAAARNSLPVLIAIVKAAHRFVSVIGDDTLDIYVHDQAIKALEEACKAVRL